jgi:hypothetical protein
MNPLSHHEILGLVEPFARQGRHVDLAASNRGERRLVFKPPAAAPEQPAALPETLQLENPAAGVFRLVRSLRLPGGQLASLQAEGPDPAQLLARVEAVAPQRQWRIGAGYEIALCQRLVPANWGTAGLVLERAVLQVDGLLLKLRVPTARGTPADIALVATGAVPALPEDLLAVLGWNWTRLRRDGTSWSSKLRVRSREPERSLRIEQALLRAAEHLARTLAEPPGRFHERLLAARWGAYFRRAIPLLTFIGLASAAVALPYLGFDDRAVARIMIFDGPLVLLGLSLCLQEMSRFEIPPWPRRPPSTAWGGSGG